MRILLAEDERALSRALVTILGKNNYSVDPVYDGEEALDYLSASEYDLAILDIMMPKMDGLSVLRKIRAKSINLPVLILTAKSEIDDKVLGLDCGANDYLSKPFDTRELLARIRALTRTVPTSDNLVKLGNLTLDRTTFELSSPFGTYRLTSKEYQMTELLLLNPRQVFSSDKLFEKIWGYDSECEINVVWVYVSFLRKKFTALKSTVEIKAARGVGYYSEEVNV